jgi:hypothetical protein
MSGDLSRYWPLSGREEIRGVVYEWDIIDRGLGMLHYSVNHEQLRTVNFKETDADFKEYIEREALQVANSERGRVDQFKDRALEICAVDGPREFILNTFKTLHIGDNDTAEGLLIGTMNQSIGNSKGLQSSVHGESGYGKSHAARAMLHLHPKEYFMITSLTDKALFYMEADELRPGMTIFCDDAEISPGIEGIIKRSTSAFQEETEHRVPMKEGGKLTTKTLKIPPRINWLLTSVDTQGSDQFVKRQISYGVDETSEQDEKVIAFELEKARDGLPEFPVTDDVIISREIIRHIKEDEKEPRLFTVKIPFAEHIKWFDVKNRRNLPIFIDMVKGFTILNFEQRKTDADGAIIATVDDFNVAARLYNSRGGFQKLHITEREKELLQFITNDGGELSTDELISKMKLSARRINQIGERLTAVLPGFSIEQRSVHVKDPGDTGKSTTTRRNYYCYTGAVTVDLFGSVVSLDKETLGAAGEHSESHSESTDLRVQKTQNEHSETNGALYNNKNNNNNTFGVNVRVRTPDETHDGSSLYVLRKTPSGHDATRTEGNNKPVSSTESGGDLEQKVRVPSERSQSALRVLIQTILLAVKDASLRTSPIMDSDNLARVIALKVKQRDPEWSDYDVLGFYKKLVENDKEIQGLIADLTGGRV